MTRASGTIGRLAVRWHADGEPDAARLEHLLHALVDELAANDWDLADAFTDELVCIREITVEPQVFPWDVRDDDLVAGWRVAISGAVRDAARGAPRISTADPLPPERGDTGVRYRSLDAAMTDLFAGVLAGRADRAWAWHQLGLWPAGRTVPPAGASIVPDDALLDHAAALLTLAPAAVLPALVRAVTVAGLAALEVLGERRVIALVDAAWHAAGGTDATPPLQKSEPSTPVRRDVWVARRQPVDAIAAWLYHRDRGTSAAAPGSAAVAAARLVVLDVEPAVAACDRSGEQVAAIGVAHRALHDGPGRDAVESLDPPPPVTDALGDHRAAVIAEPASTDWAGLCFLLHLIEDTPTRALLHGVGAMLLRRLDPEIDERDPALLAFCGLPPTAAAPGEEDRRPLAAGHDIDEEVLVLQRALLVRLLERVAVEPVATPDEVLDLVCRRRGTIEYEPGWIDVVLPLDEVVVDVRRAGLDLDVGWVPWLGCVVRFRYV